MASGTLKAHSWKLVDTKTGTAEINLPSEYTELILEVYIANQTNRTVSILVSKAQLSSTNKRFMGGSWFSTSDGAAASVNATLTKASLAFAYYGGNDFSSSSVINIYYR